MNVRQRLVDYWVQVEIWKWMSWAHCRFLDVSQLVTQKKLHRMQKITIASLQQQHWQLSSSVIR